MKIFGVNVDRRFVVGAILAAGAVALTRVGIGMLPSNQLTQPVKKVASLL